MPISSIGNLCYLPEFDNRSKGEKTIYQDSSYIDHLINKGIDISEIEDKYTFTEKSDMDWLDEEYGDDEYDKFSNKYHKFLSDRFERMKEEFCASLKIV
jgi:hypothetical protein